MVHQIWEQIQMLHIGDKIMDMDLSEASLSSHVVSHDNKENMAYYLFTDLNHLNWIW